MLTHRRVIASAIVVVLICMLGAAFVTGRRSVEHRATVRVVQSSWVADFTDRDNIVKYYDNIYVAIVLKAQSANNFFPNVDGPSPGMKYTIDVLNSLKGELSGRVEIYQFGGFGVDGAALELVAGDSLLQEGRKYLIASSNTGSPDGQVMLSTYGHTDLSALSPSEQARAVRLMRAAIAAS